MLYLLYSLDLLYALDLVDLLYWLYRLGREVVAELPVLVAERLLVWERVRAKGEGSF